MTNNNDAYQVLSAEFEANQVKSFNQAKKGDPPRWLSYVPDETVMGRLDDVFGPGGWGVSVTPANAPGVAIVTLGVKWPDNDGWTYYSDFGYPTNGERGEALKEAVSDGIRRTARFVGVARYLYAGEGPAAVPQTQPARQPQRAPEEPDDYDMGAVDDDSHCQKHGEKWWGDPEKGRYHKNGTWDDGKTRWCRHPADEARKKAARG